MTPKRNTFLSLLLTSAIVLSSFSFVLARVDEGMYPLDRVASLPLKKRGLKIGPEEIYSPNGTGINEAIVRLSIGCTGEFVSPEGLILTNHHCGFDALVSASTPEKDLVETGFNAGSRAGEIPAKGYSIQITEREEDVTASVRQGTENLSGDALTAALTKNAGNLQSAEQAKAAAGSTVRIVPMNNGYFFYLLQTREIKDIRLAYAPPRSIGVFGGDPDNFEWTRHTGDFSILRAYVAPDGSAAGFSPNNVPFKPKKFLTMNIGGLKEDDFVFAIGFPGGTTRYRESWSIEYARDANFPFLAAWLDARSAALRLIGQSDEKKRIEFQSDIANFDNSRKVYGGGAERLVKADVVEKRRAEEAQLANWIAADPNRLKRYGSMLTELRSLSEETNAAAKRDVILRRFPDAATTPVLKAITDAVTVTQIAGKTLSDTERAAKLKEIQAAYQNREPVYELEMIKFFLKALSELPEGQKFQPAEQLFGTLQGKARRDAEAAFAETIGNGEYANAEAVAGLYGPRTMEMKPEREKILSFAKGIAEERAALAARTLKFNGAIDRLRLLYQQAMAEMKGTTPYPDANFTMRFTYGNVKGYSPREAEFRTPFTTLNGMIEKDTGVNPFDVPQKLKDLQKAHDFGRYGENGTVPVNFLATTDIIGGNSGSPVLNGNGEQVGLIFDGNYEGLGNDMYYDPEKNRTIAVDIRFVLFTIEKFSNAGWIVNEMKIVGGNGRGKAASN